MNIVQTIRRYILENFLFTDDESALGNGESFFAAGIIDSTGVLEIILFIEETFGIKVDDDDMLPEHLDSVNNLATFVRRKQTVAA